MISIKIYIRYLFKIESFILKILQKLPQKLTKTLQIHIKINLPYFLNLNPSLTFPNVKSPLSLSHFHTLNSSQIFPKCLSLSLTSNVLASQCFTSSGLIFSRKWVCMCVRRKNRRFIHDRKTRSYCFNSPLSRRHFSHDWDYHKTRDPFIPFIYHRRMCEKIIFCVCLPASPVDVCAHSTKKRQNMLRIVKSGGDFGSAFSHRLHRDNTTRMWALLNLYIFVYISR